MNNKQKVGTKEEWINTRRQELLHLFQENIYSPLPTARIEYFEQKSNCSTVYNNEVIIREVTLFFGNQAPCKSFRFTIISPKLIKKVPLIIGLNFSGTNQVLFPNKAKLNGDKRWNEYPIKILLINNMDWLPAIIKISSKIKQRLLSIISKQPIQEIHRRVPLAFGHGD